MKRKHTLRSLLSMVCTIAMIISLVPVLPAAAADDLLYDNMESYTVGTDLYSQAGDKYSQKSASWNAVKDAGGTATVVADPLDSKNKVVALTTPEGDSKRYVLSTVPVLNGDYTVQFDYMPGDVEANPGSGFMDVYVNMGNAHNARIASGVYNTYFNLDKTGCSNVIKNAELDMKNQWYSVRVVVTAGQYVMDIWEKGDEDTMLTCTTTKGTKAINNAHVEFCIGPYLESQGVNTSAPITNYIDNIRITSGVVEAGAPEETEDGVSVSGGGMIEFVDEYIIENKDAVAVTAGMGIFSGKEGNRFDPYGELTRAEMATVIVKMLRGNAFNADNFKGVDTFSDTADYQGGWAEGYINACVEMGIVKGYGDGTFKPGNPVTTAEAMTMIINALKVDAGEGSWPDTVMVKAEEMKLYGDLASKPGTYDALTRDQLAVLVYEGMNYSPSGATGWMIPGTDIILDNYKDAASACTPPERPIEVKGKDSLVSKVYEMKIAEGYIVANQETSDAKYTTIRPIGGTGINFNMKTRLDQIGHYVTVYYRETWNGERDPGVVYNYVDKIETIDVEKAVTNSKEYKEAFYDKYIVADNVAKFDGSYNWIGYTSIDDIYTAGSKAAKGTYFILEGEIIGYMEPVTVYATKVLNVNNYDGNETIELIDENGGSVSISNSEDNDLVREYSGIEKDDYVLYTKVGTGVDTIYVLNKADMVRGIVTKSATNKDGDNVITLNGVEYVQFAKSNANEVNYITEFNTGDRTTEFDDGNWSTTYALYITEDGKYIGFEESEGALSISQTAFILGEVVVDTTDSYGSSIRKTYARGVDMSGNEVMLLVMVQKNGSVLPSGVFKPSRNDGDNVWDSSFEEKFNFEVPENTFCTYDLSTEKNPKKEDIYKLEAYPTTYEEDTAPIYATTAHVSAGGTVGFNGYNFGNPSMLTYTSPSVIFMTLEGELNQEEPLVGTVQKVWATSANATGAQMRRYFLLSRGADGNQLIEAAVIVSEDLKSNKTVVYVSEESLASPSNTIDGIAYTAQDYQTGVKKEITLATGSAPIDSAGYWHLVPKEDSATYIVEGKVVDSPAFNYNTTKNATNDNLYNENILHDQVMSSLINDQLSTAYASAPSTVIMTRGQKAGSGVVIDTRDEDQIKSDGMGKITSLDRINSLAKSNPEISVVFDLCYSIQSGKLLTVFIKELKFASTEETKITVSGGTYSVDGRPVADDVVINDLTGRLSSDVDFADLVDMMDDDYTVNFTYEVIDGEISTITVTNILGEGELFYEGFDQYEAGDDYVLGSGSLLVQGSNYAGNVTTKVVNEGELTLKASGGTGNRAVVATNVSFTGNYVAEARFKVDSSSNNIGMFYLSKITYNRIKSDESTVTQTRHDMRLNTDGSIHFEVNQAQADNKLSGATGDTANELYMYTGGTANDTAVGSKVSYSDDTWYIVKKYVDSTAKTVTTELWNGDGTTKLGSRTLHAGVINATTFDVEAFCDATIILDYIKVTETEGQSAPETVTYTVTPVQVDEGLLVLDKTTAAKDEEVTVTAYPEAGYKLASLKVNGGVNLVDGTDLSHTINVTFEMPAADATITAEFVKINYAKVTVTNPAEGTVTVTGADNLNKVAEGTVLTISAAATDDSRYALKAITVNGVEIEEEDGAYTYTVLTTDDELAITATFDILYTITTGTATNGAVGVDMEGSVAGTTVTVTATPDAYYKVKSITVTKDSGGTVTVTDNKFTMPEDDVTVTAEFERMTYTLTTKVNDANFGTLTGTTDGTKNAGETYTLTLTGKTGYEPAHVLVNGVKKEIESDGTYDLVVDDDTATTVTAVFWPEGSLWYEGFETYTSGAEYVDGSAYSTTADAPTIYQQYPNKDNYTLTTNTKSGTTVLTARADTYTNNCLYINYKPTGSYVFETRFKSVDDQWVNIQNIGVSTTKKGSSSTGKANYMLYVGQSTGIKLYRASSAGGADSVLVNAETYANTYLGTFITFRMTVNKTNNTVLTELLDQSGNEITSFTLDSTTTKAITVGNSANIGFDVRSVNATNGAPGTIEIDYIKVTGLN